MSSVRRIAYAGKSKPRKKGLNNLWSRKRSDDLRFKICSLYGKEAEASRDQVRQGNTLASYSYFASLPNPSYDCGSFAELDLALIQTRALFSKDGDMRSPIDKEEVALQSFVESEETCKAINEKLLSGKPLPEKGAESIIMIAKRKIESILGQCPLLEDLHVSFGPGASATCHNNTTARWKLSTPPSISKASAKYGVSRFAWLAPRWTLLHRKVLVVDGELAFVPKNYKTHRSIVMEPSLTGALQRSVGSVLKRKLYRAGIDLTDQGINRHRARLGSTGVDLCTLDLSRASDSIAYALVMELLPGDWFELLDSLRTPVVWHKKTRFELEKFSSMGNGYTFELESLLFYALAYAVAEHFGVRKDITVYGDDIIVPHALALLLNEWLPVFGFQVNTDKSYYEGPFRESCGFDSFLGVDVRPFYLKDRFTYARVISFYNFLMRKPWFDPTKEIRALLYRELPHRFSIFGPDGYGDGHLVSGDPASTLQAYRRKDGWAGYIFYTFVSVPYEDDSDVIGDVLLPSYASESQGVGWSDSVYQVRKDLTKLKTRKVRVYILGVEQ